MIRLICICSVLVSTTVPALPQARLRKPPAPPIKLAFQRGREIWGLTNEGETIRLLKNARSPAWSWDGKRLAFYRDGALWIVAANDWANPRKWCALPIDKKVVVEEYLSVPEFTWHPKFPQIATFVFEEYKLVRGTEKSSTEDGVAADLASVLSIRTDRHTREDPYSRWLEPSTRGWGSIGWLSASHPSWSPKGDKLAYVRGGGLWIAEVSPRRDNWYEFGRQRIQQWEEYGTGVNVRDGGGVGSSNVMGVARITWHPNNKRVAYHVTRWNGGSDNWLMLIDVVGEKRAKPVDLGLGASPSFAPDARLFYLDPLGKSGLEIWAMDVRTGVRRKVVENASFPACNPDKRAWRVPSPRK